MPRVRFSVGDSGDDDPRQANERKSVIDARPSNFDGTEQLLGTIEELEERIADLEAHNSELAAAAKDKAREKRNAPQNSRKSLARGRQSVKSALLMAKFAKVDEASGSDDDDGDDGPDMTPERFQWLWQMAIRSVVAHNKLKKIRVLLLKKFDATRNDLDAKCEEVCELRVSNASLSHKARVAKVRSQKQLEDSEAKHQDQQNDLRVQIEMLQGQVGGSFQPCLDAAMSLDFGGQFHAPSEEELALERVSLLAKERVQKLETERAQAQELAQGLAVKLAGLRRQVDLTIKNNRAMEARAKASCWHTVACCNCADNRGAAGKAPQAPQILKEDSPDESSQAGQGCTGASR